MTNYAKSLETYLFRKSWGNIFKTLPDEKAGMLIKSIYAFVEGEENTLEDPELTTFYKVITQQINHSSRKYLHNLWEKSNLES